MSLTSFEVKQIATYLRSSCLRLPPSYISPKLGYWHEVISRASGFRDWNAMVANVPDTPKMEWGEWSSAFFGFARVLIDGKEASNHIFWHRKNESSRYEVAEKLAQSVLDLHGATLRRANFKYSQPDWDQPDFYILTPANVRQHMQFHRHAAPPVIASSTDGEVTLMLWWLSASYTMAERMPERQRVFSCQSFHFDSDESPGATFGAPVEVPDSLTERFINSVTGSVLPKRICLYIPLMPNGPDETFVPVRVQECSGRGELTSSDFGIDRVEAELRVNAINAQNGLTVADMRTIVRRYNKHEPYPEDDILEYSGIYDE